jgi:hypothetical protein
MRLSEAIRLGSTLNRQGFGDFRTYGGVNGVRTCALGAALAAVGVTELPTIIADEGVYYALFWRWPYVQVRRVTTCPSGVCGHAAIPLNELIAHLNDMHRWTRERIADWVATMEPTELDASDEPLIRRVGERDELVADSVVGLLATAG